MNEAHKLGKKRNRIKRIQRLLIDKDIPIAQKNILTQRMNELLGEARTR